jgi:hypothetical protein
MTEPRESFDPRRKRAAMAVLGMLVLILLPLGCQKAGDGIGLDPSGQRIPFCKAYPDDPSCVAVDPCIANPSLPQCKQDTCKTVPPAPGCSVDVCKTNPDHPSCRPKVKFDQVLAIVLKETNRCQQCHTGQGAGVTTGKLLLTVDSAYGKLVNAPVANAANAQKGWVRVKPGSPDSSVFFLKISMASPKLPDGTAIGARMPLYNNALDTGSINIVKQWILDGAEK